MLAYETYLCTVRQELVCFARKKILLCGLWWFEGYDGAKLRGTAAEQDLCGETSNSVHLLHIYTPTKYREKKILFTKWGQAKQERMLKMPSKSGTEQKWMQDHCGCDSLLLVMNIHFKSNGVIESDTSGYWIPAVPLQASTVALWNDIKVWGLEPWTPISLSSIVRATTPSCPFVLGFTIIIISLSVFLDLNRASFLSLETKIICMQNMFTRPSYGGDKPLKRRCTTATPRISLWARHSVLFYLESTKKVQCHCAEEVKAKPPLNASCFENPARSP